MPTRADREGDAGVSVDAKLADHRVIPELLGSRESAIAPLVDQSKPPVRGAHVMIEDLENLNCNITLILCYALCFPEEEKRTFLRIKHVGLVIQRVISPDHSHDLVCHGIGVTRYSTQFRLNRAFK